MSYWLSTTSLMRPSLPSWLEEICQRLIDNDESLSLLELIHPRIDDVFARVVAKALKENNVVTTLIISCYSIVDDGAYAIGSALGASKSIKMLQFRDLRNQREITTLFTQLLQNTKVTELSLRHCDICPRGAETIAKFLQNHPKLQEIRITDCQLLGDSLEILCHGMKSNTNIQRVYFVNDEIDEYGAFHVAGMLRTSCMRELYLGENDLGDEGVATIANGVLDSTSIRVLDLRSNLISANGALSLQGMIVSSEHLLALNLSENRLGNSGIMCLARGLMQSRCYLERLDLDSNGIDETGAGYIAMMLRCNQHLKGLKISFNAISNEGAESIASALVRNSTLQFLSIQRNGISNEGAFAFAERLPRMNGLKELQLTRNDIDNVGLSALLRGLSSNVHLEHLSVEEKGSEPTTREILQLLRLNKAGRKIFRENNSVPLVLWSRVYSRICSEPDVMFHFVTEKPDVIMLQQH